MRKIEKDHKDQIAFIAVQLLGRTSPCPDVCGGDWAGPSQEVPPSKGFARSKISPLHGFFFR